MEKTYLKILRKDVRDNFLLIHTNNNYKFCEYSWKKFLIYNGEWNKIKIEIKAKGKLK